MRELVLEAVEREEMMQELLYILLSPNMFFGAVIIGAIIIPKKIFLKESTAGQRLIIIGIFIIELLFFVAGLILQAKWHAEHPLSAYISGSHIHASLGVIREIGYYMGFLCIISFFGLIRLIIWAIRELKEE